MNILQSIISKVNSVFTEAKFKRNLKKFIAEQESRIEYYVEQLEENVLKGHAEDAYYNWVDLENTKSNLETKKKFVEYMYSKVA